MRAVRDGTNTRRTGGGARGWVKVMNVDVICSMIIYTVATIAFYLLGAGILHGMGQVPATSDMIPMLSNIYTETLGGWAKWLFYVGAIIILYGTIFAATAGDSRMFADCMRLQGKFEHDDMKSRNRWRDIFIVILSVIPVVLYFIFGLSDQPLHAQGAQRCALDEGATVHRRRRHYCLRAGQ